MNPQRPVLNPNHSYSKSQSVWWGGTLNVISAHDVFLLTIVTLPLQDAAIIGSIVSKVAFLKPYSHPVYFSRKSCHNCHVHGKLKSLNWYCCLRKRMEISLSLTESTGWSWLLWTYHTNSTDSTRHQSSKLGLWSPVFKAEQLIRNFTEPQCVLVINCLPQTCNMSPDTWYWMEWWKYSAVSGDAISAA